MRIDVPIKISLGAEPTLDDLREVVEKTKKVAGGASLKFEISRGQRDSETVAIVIQGAALLED